MQLKSAQGTLVTVSEDKAQRLRQSGYKDVSQSSNPAPESAPKKRGKPKKAEDSKDLEQMIWDDESGG